MRSCASNIECGGVLTIVKVRDCLQNVAAGVEGLRSTDPTRGVPVRIHDDLCVDEVPGGDSSIQSLAERSCSRHVCKRVGGVPLVIGRIYGTCVMQQVHPFLVDASKRGGVDGNRMIWVGMGCRSLGLDTSELKSNGHSYVTEPNNRDNAIEIDDVKWLLQSVPVGLEPGVCGRCRKRPQSRQPNGMPQQTRTAK